MSKKKIVIEIEFDEVTEDDYTYLEFARMNLTDDSTVTKTEREGLAESWGQSDWYSVGLVNSLINLLDTGETVEADDVKSY